MLYRPDYWLGYSELAYLWFRFRHPRRSGWVSRADFFFGWRGIGDKPDFTTVEAWLEQVKAAAFAREAYWLARKGS